MSDVAEYSRSIKSSREGIGMLNEGTVYATIAVKSLTSGKEFYGQTLGLKQVDENAGGVTYQSGTGKIFIYEAPTAGTNQATSAFWEVSDIDAAVEDLKSKGMSFEHYDLPGTTLEGDIHVTGSMKGAWFKDPDGNILAVASNG
jgi:catechol 2,3-dioxygenase-like lactoylglutathione lyase family enzyme